MMNFVASNHRHALKRVFQGRTDAFLAVSFLGKGASDRLKAYKCRPSRTRIVCNLESGACNPVEIRRLLRLGFDVRSNRDLHAKVYWTARAALVSSANLSANGLGYEGADVDANIEAGTLIDDPGNLKKVESWIFEKVLPNSKLITRKMLREAELVWERRRKNRHANLRPQQSFLEKMKREPEFFDGMRIFVAVYRFPLEEDAEEALEESRKARSNSRLTAYECYELGGKKPEPGDYIIDIDATGQKNLCRGLYKIVEDNPEVRWKGGYIHLAVKSTRFEGCSFGPAERRHFTRCFNPKRPRRIRSGDWRLDKYLKSRIFLRK